MLQTKVVKMTQVNVTPQEVLSKIWKKVCDEENDDIDDINFLASGDYKNCKNRLNIIQRF